MLWWVLLVRLGILFSAIIFSLFSPLALAGTTEAVSWLKANQQADGSYGMFADHHAAAAAIGLYNAEGNSSNASAALSWMKAQLENPSSWFWGTWGEADVPGAMAYAFVQANQSNQLNYSIVTPLLLEFQPSTGFKGYYDFSAGGGVPSSVDTALAVMALGSTQLPSVNRTAAQNFLLSLQNSDGSFNLTPTISSDAIYSQGPDKASMTALVLLALKTINYTGTPTQSAVSFLKNESATCFGNANRAYTAALASIAFSEYGESDYAKSSANYLLSLQKADGGFADSSRSNPNASNALDTGWAAAAVAKANPGSYPFSCAPVLSITLTADSPIVNGTSERITLTATGSVSNVTAIITLPNSTISSMPLSYSNGKWENAFNTTSLVGTYSVIASVYPANGNSTNVSTSFTTALPVQVGVVTTFPNGTTVTNCVQAANGSSGETVLKSTGLSSTWASMGAFGNALTAIDGTGCPSSDPWCQCSDYTTCCLLWNFWLVNKTSGSWYFAPSGYSTLAVFDGDVFGNIWTSDAAKAPPVYSYSQICPGTTSSSTNSSFTDAPTCSSCTSNSQCTSGFCVHSTCRSSATYCGDGYCDSPESSSSCPGDCPTAGGGGSYSLEVGVKILFPQEAGKPNVNQNIPVSNCPSAYDCFSKAVTIGCQWYPATGGLGCPGMPQVTSTCLATSVNGYSGSGWWGFYVNNGLVNIGISCYKPVAGDVVELRYSTGTDYSESETAAPVPASAIITPSPSVIAPSVSPAASAIAGQETTDQAASVGGEKSFGQTLAGQGESTPTDANEKSVAPIAAIGFFTGNASTIAVIVIISLGALGAAAVYLKKL